jgi:SAM-dependent methyltransferase
MAGHTHTHDGIDWTTRLVSLRRADEIEAGSYRAVAERLIGMAGPGATVIDVGAGAGGMSAALAVALAKDGGRIVLVDAVPELLSAATEQVERALRDSADRVEVSGVLVDAASEDLPSLVPPADLVWASRVVHHLPDQRKGIEGLVRVLGGPGSVLALVEGGLATRCLPWDLGVGEPGLADRVAAARDAWFARMRADMPGAVRMPVGWNRALVDAGLVDVTSFSYLIDLPAPASEQVRLAVVDWLAWQAGVGEDELSPSDRAAVQRLLDPDDLAYVGARDDVFILGASTVYLGRKP